MGRLGGYSGVVYRKLRYTSGMPRPTFFYPLTPGAHPEALAFAQALDLDRCRPPCVTPPGPVRNSRSIFRYPAHYGDEAALLAYCQELDAKRRRKTKDVIPCPPPKSRARRPPPRA